MSSNPIGAITADFRIRVPDLVDAHYGAAATAGLAIKKVLNSPKHRVLLIPVEITVDDGFLVRISGTSMTAIRAFLLHPALRDTISHHLMIVVSHDFDRNDFSVGLETLQFLAELRSELSIYRYPPR